MGVDGRLNGRRVLVVEDEAMIAALIEMTLREAGCSVVGPIAGAGHALAAIERESFDAVVLDICDGDSRSYPLADALLARGVPFLFVSGLACRDMPADYRACPYVTKPFTPDALISALDRTISRPRAS